MIKTTMFENIGFGKFAKDIITITELFTESNDFEGCYVSINGEMVSASISTREAIEDALDAETAEWILRRK